MAGPCTFLGEFQVRGCVSFGPSVFGCDFTARAAPVYTARELPPVLRK